MGNQLLEIKKNTLNCNSKNAPDILICNKGDYFYLGKTVDFKRRIRTLRSLIDEGLWNSRGGRPAKFGSCKIRIFSNFFPKSLEIS